jgi:hypothetical protein
MVSGRLRGRNQKTEVRRQYTDSSKQIADGVLYPLPTVVCILYSVHFNLHGSRFTVYDSQHALMPFPLQPSHHHPCTKAQHSDGQDSLPGTHHMKHLAKVRLDPERFVPLERRGKNNMQPANAVAGTLHSLLRVLE